MHGCVLEIWAHKKKLNWPGHLWIWGSPNHMFTTKSWLTKVWFGQIVMPIWSIPGKSKLKTFLVGWVFHQPLLKKYANLVRLDQFPRVRFQDVQWLEKPPGLFTVFVGKIPINLWFATVALKGASRSDWLAKTRGETINSDSFSVAFNYVVQKIWSQEICW